MRWLKSIWTILGSIAAGVMIGIYQPQLAGQLIPYGGLYLSFLKMCVIPIMVTAIVSSVGRLFMSTGSNKVLNKMLLVFIVGMLAVSVLGITAGLLGKPGEGISAGSKTVLGTIVLDNESSSADQADTASANGLMDFIFKLIPDNIFIALTQGNSLQILFFSVVVGIALGLLSVHTGEHFLSLVDLMFKVFQRIISWSMYVLPFGLLCIMAGQIASTGADLLLAMVKFIALAYTVALVLMIASGWIMAAKLKISFIQALKGLKETLIIAFGTQNSIATMPSALDSLRKQFKLDSDSVNLVVPLGVVLCRYSMVVVYSLGIIFIAQLYGVTLGLQDLFIIMAGAVLAAVAGAGTPGIVAIAMISLIADPLNLPSSTGIILLMAVNPIIDPILTTANIHLNSMAAVLIVDKAEDTQTEAADYDPLPLGSSGTAS